MNKVVNDFSITVGTVNGSGSQTANTTILRALFKMGIPVSGKNLFPSNIQGLPTWYTIRVNKDGFVARRDETEVMVAINPNSFACATSQRFNLAGLSSTLTILSSLSPAVIFRLIRCPSNKSCAAIQMFHRIFAIWSAIWFM